MTGAYVAAVPGAPRDGVRCLVHGLPWSLRRYATRSFLALPPGARRLFFDNFADFPEALQRQLLRELDRFATRDPYGNRHRYCTTAPDGTLEKMSHVDLQTYMVELLMKQDQMSIAASVESRVPFLDHRFVEYVTAMPGRFKLRGWRTEAVLREALRGLVSAEILSRRKMGFAVPVGRWFRGPFWPLIEEFVLSPRALARGFFDPAAVRRLAEDHRRGVSEHGERLWLLVNLDPWQRTFSEGEDVSRVIRLV